MVHYMTVIGNVGSVVGTALTVYQKAMEPTTRSIRVVGKMISDTYATIFFYMCSMREL